MYTFLGTLCTFEDSEHDGGVESVVGIDGRRRDIPTPNTSIHTTRETEITNTRHLNSNNMVPSVLLYKVEEEKDKVSERKYHSKGKNHEGI